jgi:cob(I)alamin adenosyltransferase
MVQLTRIYTRGGDAGETSLGSGKRVPKYDTRVASYGTVDETNSVIGVARLNVDSSSDIDDMLARVQNDLFDLGADLCTPESKSLSI